MLNVGLHYDVDPDKYHADPCARLSLSASVAHTLVSRSPLHAWLQHPKLGGKSKAPTKAMDLGSVCHALLLGRGKQFAVIQAPPGEEEFQDFKKKLAKDGRDAARAAGKVPLLTHQLVEANEVAQAISARLWSDFRIKLDGASEVVAVWEREGVLCRGAMDHLKLDEAHVFDLKIVRSAHPKACQSHLVGYGGDIQAAAYIEAIETLVPELQGRVKFTFLFCEAEEPHAVTPVMVRGGMREFGQRRWSRAIPQWAQCVKANRWPGYVTEPISVDPPAWAMFAEEDAAIQDNGGMRAEPEGPSNAAPSFGEHDGYGNDAF